MLKCCRQNNTAATAAAAPTTTTTTEANIITTFGICLTGPLFPSYSRLGRFGGPQNKL